MTTLDNSKKIAVGLAVAILFPTLLYKLWDVIDLFHGQSALVSYIKASFIFNFFDIVKFGVIQACVMAAIFIGARVKNGSIGGGLIIGASVFVVIFGLGYIKSDILQQDLMVIATSLSVLSLTMDHE